MGSGVSGFRFRVWGLGFGFRVWGFEVWDFVFRVSSFALTVGHAPRPEFGSLGFRVSGFALEKHLVFRLGCPPDVSSNETYLGILAYLVIHDSG